MSAPPTPRWLDADGSELGRPSLVMVRERGECATTSSSTGSVRSASGWTSPPGSAICWRRSTWSTGEQPGSAAVSTIPGPARRSPSSTSGSRSCVGTSSSPIRSWSWRWTGCAGRAPSSPRTVLVHGDFKPGNVLLDGDEIGRPARLGARPPRRSPRGPGLGHPAAATRRAPHRRASGRPSTCFARYESATGTTVDVTAVAWWNVFACLKTAVMQVSGLRSYVEGRHPEPYQPTAAPLAALLDLSESVMHPTTEEHLAAVRRLLEGVAADPGVSDSSRVALDEAARRLRRVERSGAARLPFLVRDNRASRDAAGRAPRHGARHRGRRPRDRRGGRARRTCRPRAEQAAARAAGPGCPRAARRRGGRRVACPPRCSTCASGSATDPVDQPTEGAAAE